MKPLYRYKQYPMDNNAALIMMMALTDRENAETKALGILQEVADEVGTSTMLYKIMQGRLRLAEQMFGFTVKPSVQLFVLHQTANPSTISLYVHAMWSIHKAKGVNEITMDHLAEVFPDGFPDETELAKAWADQKTKHHKISNVVSDNMVDLFELYDSHTENL